jgi:nucleotide-binding universal stress UspA family protein
MTNYQDLNHSTLVPIDFSQNSLLAMDHAVALSNALLKKTEHIITLLHVIEGGHFDFVYGGSQIEPGGRDALAIEGAMNRLQKLAESYQGKSNAAFKYIVAGGKAYKMIVEIAETIQADIIVMGTHGSSGIQAFAGSNASKVIQIAPCPVVVIKEKAYDRGYKNIVLPLDLSKETKQKVNVAVKIAQYYNATINIVSMTASDAFLTQRLHANLAQVESYLQERDINYTTTELEGNFAMNTLTWAHGRNADLIIIMADRDRGFTEYIFGTEAQQIVNRSSIPVMAVKPDEKLEGVLDRTLGTGIYSH